MSNVLNIEVEVNGKGGWDYADPAQLDNLAQTQGRFKVTLRHTEKCRFNFVFNAQVVNNTQGVDSQRSITSTSKKVATSFRHFWHHLRIFCNPTERKVKNAVGEDLSKRISPTSSPINDGSFGISHTRHVLEDYEVTVPIQDQSTGAMDAVPPSSFENEVKADVEVKSKTPPKTSDTLPKASKNQQPEKVQAGDAAKPITQSVVLRGKDTAPEGASPLKTTDETTSKEEVLSEQKSDGQEGVVKPSVVEVANELGKEGGFPESTSKEQGEEPEPNPPLSDTTVESLPQPSSPSGAQHETQIAAMGMDRFKDGPFAILAPQEQELHTAEPEGSIFTISDSNIGTTAAPQQRDLFWLKKSGVTEDEVLEIGSNSLNQDSLVASSATSPMASLSKEGAIASSYSQISTNSADMSLSGQPQVTALDSNRTIAYPEEISASTKGAETYVPSITLPKMEGVPLSEGSKLDVERTTTCVMHLRQLLDIKTDAKKPLFAFDVDNVLMTKADGSERKTIDGQSAEEINYVFRELKKRYPQCRIVAVTTNSRKLLTNNTARAGHFEKLGIDVNLVEHIIDWQSAYAVTQESINDHYYHEGIGFKGPQLIEYIHGKLNSEIENPEKHVPDEWQCDEVWHIDDAESNLLSTQTAARKEGINYRLIEYTGDYEAHLDEEARIERNRTVEDICNANPRYQQVREYCNEYRAELRRINQEG